MRPGSVQNLLTDRVTLASDISERKIIIFNGGKKLTSSATHPAGSDSGTRDGDVWAPEPLLVRARQGKKKTTTND